MGIAAVLAGTDPVHGEFPSRYQVGQQFPLLSNSRIGLEAFPAFMMLGRLGRHPWLDQTIVSFGLLIQGLLAARYLFGQWVA